MSAAALQPTSRPAVPTDWQSFVQECQSAFDSANVFSDYARRFAYGTDASFYRLVPRLVVRVQDEEQVVTLLRSAARYGVPLTFRAAGTSLSGQAVTDSVLVLIGDGWNGLHVGDAAETVDLQPGVIGAHANRALARWGRKIGPDPASLESCKIGGIVANNASGMCCGTTRDSYRTMAGIRVVLVDGSVLDTRDADSIRSFRESHSGFLERLASLASRARREPGLAETIRQKYRLKNTTGYSLNALIDFEDPVEILAHLMVGSEGTLGFISEVTLRTIPDHRERAAALVYFEEVDACCRVIERLRSCPVNALELMDQRALATVNQATLTAVGLQSFKPGSNGAALLIETGADDSAGLSANMSLIARQIEQSSEAPDIRFEQSRQGLDELWKMRKGLFPTVGAARPNGTTVVIEDIALPANWLAAGIRDLQHLFLEYGYDEAIIFGHALDGNLHFVFSQSFDCTSEVKRYRGFMDAMCRLVTRRYGGSLKAEHGTGRNIAPYVEMEWGRQAYALMRDIKALCDPENLLNPGVILNDDTQAHVRHLKSMPVAHDLVDKCTECGFCEAVCPARALTLSPRQRIALYREIQRRARDASEPGVVAELSSAFSWLGIDTCAATGLCEDRCPVGINTGALVTALRARHRRDKTRVADWLARHFESTTAILRGGLAIADAGHAVLGTNGMAALCGGLRNLSGNRIPCWVPTMPRPGRPSRLGRQGKPTGDFSLVYWPSCVSRNLSPMRGSRMQPLPDTVLKVLAARGFRVAVLADNSLCCGQPFASKGFPVQAERKLTELAAALRTATDKGRIPAVTDTSPCALRVRASGQYDLTEPIEFIHGRLLEKGAGLRIPDKVALHITCSTRRMGLAEKAQEIAESLVADVVVPRGVDCCGFAGDRGFSVPELNASSLCSLRGQVQDCSRGYSSSLTCETGLSYHSGIEYRSMFHLIDDVATGELIRGG